MANKSKRRGKGKKKPNMIRTEDGRISRSQEAQEAHQLARNAVERETQRQARETAVSARMRVYGVSEEIAAKQEAGTALGLLALDGKITGIQKEAGKRYSLDMERYYRCSGVPFPSARAMDMFAVRGYQGETTQQEADAARRATDKMMHLEGLLLRCNGGRQVKEKVFQVCVLDELQSRNWNGLTIGLLKSGLNALAEEYGIATGRG